MSGPQPSSLRAEPQLRERLGRIDASAHFPEGALPVSIDQPRADAILARAAWSRIAEPGDGAAGALLAALGAEAALELLVRGTSPSKLREASVAAGAELPLRALEEALGRWLPRLDRNETIADIERAFAARMRVVPPGDEGWPAALDDLGLHAPTMLWVRGRVECLATPSLSVVGARAATGYGSHVTAEIVDGVCTAGLAIVSGGAYGIDAVAHRTALAAGAPTVAVLAGGADRPYPRSHDRLFESIAEQGAVCAEMVPGSSPTRWRFLQRNRIIAALSAATLVTEAGLRSGSLNTAGHAAQLGRAVGAVPGPITSPASAGCHRLVRDYTATLVTTAREACELLGLDDELALSGSGGGLLGGGSETGGGDEDRELVWQRRVRDALPLRGSRTLAEISKNAGLAPGQVRGVLAELDLLGMARRHEQPGGAPPRWSLIR